MMVTHHMFLLANPRTRLCFNLFLFITYYKIKLGIVKIPEPKHNVHNVHVNKDMYVTFS